MKLGSYLRDRRITQTQFGLMVGCSPSSVSRIIAGLQMPSLELAVEIERSTEGMVTPADFFPTPSEGAAA